MYNHRHQSEFSLGLPVKNSSSHDLTALLQNWCSGDQGAFDKLIPAVYAELHRLAHIYMVRERPGHTLQTSALVNEAYLRLIDARNVDWKDRTHFFAIAANLMRRVLVEFARAHGSQKRRGEWQKESLDEAHVATPVRGRDLVALDEALTSLAKVDARQAQVVELRYFGGLTAAETAEVLGVSEVTVMRDWKSAKLWLLHELRHHRE